MGILTSLFLPKSLFCKLPSAGIVDTMSFDKVKFQDDSAVEEVKTVQFRSRAVDPSVPPKKPDPPVEETMVEPVAKKIAVGVLVGVIFAGIVTGYAVARFSPVSGPAQVETAASPEEVEDKLQIGAVFGVPDEKTFRDDAEGVLIKGGISGEGSHTLLRAGGPSQNVYLTSSVVDLDQFENMQVRVWGETFKAQKAGWLMDVGRLEVKALEGQKPAWYKEDNE